MIIIRTMNPETLARLVAQSLHDRLRVMPAVVVTGARQTGKSTMVQELVPRGRHSAGNTGRGAARARSAARREAGDRPTAAAGTVPAHRLGEPAPDAPGLRVARRPSELSHPLADDAARAAGARTLRS